MLQSIFNTVKLEKFMTKWEYVIVTIKVIELLGMKQYQETFINFKTDPDKTVILDELGSYGWELVGWEGEEHTFKRALFTN